MVCQGEASVTPAGPYPTLLGCQSVRPEPGKEGKLTKDMPAPEKRLEEEKEEGRHCDPVEDEEEGGNVDKAQGSGSAGECSEPNGQDSSASEEKSAAEKEQEDFWLAASKALEDATRREQVRAFLKKNSFTGVGTPKNGWLFSFTYPLHRAVEQNDPGMVSALLKSNAEAHVRNSEGKTPRQLAKSLNFMGSHEEVLKVLKRDRKPGPGTLRKRRLAAAAAAREAAAEAAAEEEQRHERLPTLPEGAVFGELPCTKTTDAAVQCNLFAEEENI